MLYGGFSSKTQGFQGLEGGPRRPAGPRTEVVCQLRYMPPVDRVGRSQLNNFLAVGVRSTALQKGQSLVSSRCGAEADHGC